jgi:MinD-like ATPase involved in chromosome partitioning or flagellar assembly
LIAIVKETSMDLISKEIKYEKHGDESPDNSYRDFRAENGCRDGFHNKNKIIAVVSNKGGVGKTSVAIASAIFLSQKMGKRILLLEMDCSPGDFGFLFDIEKDKSLELALRFPGEYKDFIKSIDKNLDVLKGISDPIVAENIKEDSVNRLMDNISKDYDFIIIDTQTIINGPVLDVLKLSNKIFIISEYSLDSVARISKLIDILVKKFSIQESKIKLVLNKRKLVHYFVIWDVLRTIEMPIYGFINFDKRFNKNTQVFNKTAILKTVFFKEISRMLSILDESSDDDVKR